MKLLVLHGFSQNGAVMRAHLATLLAPFGDQLNCVYPNAPHACSEEAITRLRSMLGEVLAPPHRCWWNATDDGRLYRGYAQSLSILQDYTSDGAPFGILGFSQGAVFGATLAALAQRGEFAQPSFVALVAGRIPRAAALKPLFDDTTLALPSLHVWGERDPMARDEAPKLAEKFLESTRELVCWGGPHVLPTFGKGAEAIAAFLRKQACI